MPNQYVNKVQLGSEVLLDLTADTVAPGTLLLGYTAHDASGAPITGTASGGHAAITGEYDSASKKLTLDTEGVIDAWWGGIGAELMGETRWSAAVDEAANWPLTPKTTAQNLTWVTSYTATANANATVDRIGNGYHGVTETLDFGVYNYIVMEDAFVHYEYTSPEASLGKVHTIYDGFTTVYHWGARARIASGAIIRPSATTYGTYGSCAYSAALIGYRTAAGTLQLANNATYGVSAAAIAPSMNSTSSRTPSYFNVRIPTFGIRAHNTYMPVASYNELDWTQTTVNFRNRIYRVPVEYGAYTVINERLLDMIQDETFPAEPV